VGKNKAARHPVTDYRTGLRLVYVHLPRRLSCSQCILQWTYTAGNNWGVCSNGTGELGCGPQETFRACSDIRILPSGKRKPAPSKISSFSDSTTFDLNDFEDYYDELFGGQSDNINAIDGPDDDFEVATVMSIQTNKLKLIHKKLVLAKALKSLRHLIAQSHEKEKEREREEERRSPASKFSPAPTYTTYTPSYTPKPSFYTTHSTSYNHYTPKPSPYSPPSSSRYTPLSPDSEPLYFASSALATSSFLDQLDRDRQTSTNTWSGSNSHGRRKKKRRRRRFSDLIYKMFA